MIKVNGLSDIYLYTFNMNKDKNKFHKYYLVSTIYIRVTVFKLEP